MTINLDMQMNSLINKINIYEFNRIEGRKPSPVSPLIKDLRLLVRQDAFKNNPQIRLNVGRNIKIFSEEKNAYYQASFFGCIKRVISCFRNLFAFGKFLSTGQMGLQLSLQLSNPERFIPKQESFIDPVQHSTNPVKKSDEFNPTLVPDKPQIPVTPTQVMENPQIPVIPIQVPSKPQIPVTPTQVMENPQIPVIPIQVPSKPQIRVWPSQVIDNPRIPVTPTKVTAEAQIWVRKINSLKISELIGEDFINLLIEGRNANYLNQKIPEFFNGTIWHYFSKISDGQHHIDLLVSVGSDPSIVDDFGNTGLTWAVANANNSTAMQIIKSVGSGPHLNIQGLFGNTALHLAVAKGYTNQSSKGVPLEYSNLELVNEFLHVRANPNLRNVEGNTPLHLACLRRDLSMISALIKAGATTDIKNNNGQIPKELITLSYSQAFDSLKNTCAFFLLSQNEYEENLLIAQNLL